MQFLKTQDTEIVATLLQTRIFPLYAMVVPSPYVLANSNWLLGELASCLPEVENPSSKRLLKHPSQEQLEDLQIDSFQFGLNCLGCREWFHDCAVIWFLWSRIWMKMCTLHCWKLSWHPILVDCRGDLYGPLLQEHSLPFFRFFQLQSPSFSSCILVFEKHMDMMLSRSWTMIVCLLACGRKNTNHDSGCPCCKLLWWALKCRMKRMQHSLCSFWEQLQRQVKMMLHHMSLPLLLQFKERFCATFLLILNLGPRCVFFSRMGKLFLKTNSRMCFFL